MKNLKKVFFAVGFGLLIAYLAHTAWVVDTHFEENLRFEHFHLYN